jgi:hypothetical protein
VIRRDTGLKIGKSASDFIDRWLTIVDPPHAGQDRAEGTESRYQQ